MDGYIAFGEISASSIKTTNKTIIKMTAFLPVGNTYLPRADSAGNARVEVGGAAGDQHTFLLDHYIKYLRVCL